ncbi:MAG: hypothetical protein RMK18_06630 [Armatimonadota bacterium]|nr:hypothetical protein [Armatimonadota bacterium]MCX7777468.1 hypothetical protein [Armatimonadota bacterium]MDW8025523.1 hypothetical protein [Armatimonadota bacterium]
MSAEREASAKCKQNDNIALCTNLTRLRLCFMAKYKPNKQGLQQRELGFAIFINSYHSHRFASLVFGVILWRAFNHPNETLPLAQQLFKKLHSQM